MAAGFIVILPHRPLQIAPLIIMYRKIGTGEELIAGLLRLRPSPTASFVTTRGSMAEESPAIPHLRTLSIVTSVIIREDWAVGSTATTPF